MTPPLKNLPPVPRTEQYVKALTHLEKKINPLQRKLLVAHYHFPGHAATARELAQKIEAKSYRAINGLYGPLGKKLREAMQYYGYASRGGQESYVIASFEKPVGKEWTWYMHGNLADALIQLGWVNDDQGKGAKTIDERESPVNIPEEISSPMLYIEGASQTIKVNAYERDPRARKACIEHFGTNCFICDFDFGAIYGELGQGFIHVHHIVPLADIGKSYTVEPIKDLRPVCPNCHAMLHRRAEVLHVDSLKNILHK